MSAMEEKIGDVFGATLSRQKFVKRGGALVVGLSVIGAAGVGSKAAKAAGGTTLDATLPSSWLEIHADNTILMRTGQGRARSGLGEHGVRADPRRGAERPLHGHHRGRDGRHRPHA